MYGGSILKKLILPIALTASLLLPSVAFGAGTYKVGMEILCGKSL